MKKFDVIVVGGGSAGILAAGGAAQSGLSVLLLEKMSRLGRKLLITGKGRCNISNDALLAEFLTHVHPNGKILRPAFSNFFNKDIIALLKNEGVDISLERGGRYFPTSNKAEDVLEGLLSWMNKFEVDIELDCSVKEIRAEDNKIIGLRAEKNGTEVNYACNSVVVATGGKSYPATGSTGDGYKLVAALGHTIVDTRPSLVPVVTEGSLAERLQGLSLKNVKASVWINKRKAKEDFGEMLFTHFGLSGPIILTLSRTIVDALARREPVEVSIDIKPALSEQQLNDRLLRDLNEHGKKQLVNVFKLWLPSKMVPVFIDELKLDAQKLCNQVSAEERKRIRILLKDFRFKVTGNRSFKEAIITAGGVSLKEVNPKSMESKLVNNLYFAGEVLDLDADTGGYNLQIAYSTGWLAGCSVRKVGRLKV
jgi:predicted Rossmann fold flavoprotein